MENDGHFSGGIVGIGTDLTDVARIRSLLEKYSDAFLKKAFGDVEASYCMSLANPAESLAARFAAKEAVAKAFGTGFSEGVTLRGIVVVKTPSGAPQVELDAPSKKIMDSLGGKKIFLSLTHTKDYAQAFAIITR